MTRAPRAVFIAGLVGGALAAPLAQTVQNPLRESISNQAPAAATVSGSVADSAGKPARDALVMIAGIDVGLVRATATDESGRFSFTAIPPGRFLLSAGKTRYIAAMYGALRAGRPGSELTIRATESIKDLRLVVSRGASISGRVLDEQGQPIAGARVRVLGRRMVGTEVALGGDAGDPTIITTDDRGAYRAFDLPAGDYVVGVMPRGVATGDTPILQTNDVESDSHAPTPGSNGASIAYVPKFYPDTALANQAAVLTLTEGAERTGIDIRTTLARFARIDGVISGGGIDRVPPQHQIVLRPRGLDSSGTALYGQNVRATPDGHFSFTNVPPGDYTIFARTQPPNTAPPGLPPVSDPPSWALADVSVTGADLTGISLTWQPSLSVSGHVAVEGLTTLPPDLRIRVLARPTPASGVPAQNTPIVVDDSGRFTIGGLLPGKYRISAVIPQNPVTQVQDWFAKAAMIGGIDALDVPFELTAGAAPADIAVTLTDDAQQIDGRVKNAQGKAAANCPVVVFPVDQRLWFPQSRRIVVRASNDNGELLFGLASALPPGDYYVAVAPGLADNEQFDPAVLSELATRAQRMTLAPNDSKTVSLVIGKTR